MVPLGVDKVDVISALIGPGLVEPGQFRPHDGQSTSNGVLLVDAGPSPTALRARTVQV